MTIKGMNGENYNVTGQGQGNYNTVGASAGIASFLGLNAGNILGGGCYIILIFAESNIKLVRQVRRARLMLMVFNGLFLCLYIIIFVNSWKWYI